MPTYIKAGYWEKLKKGYKGFLDLEDLISGISVLNQKGTPSFYSDTFANLPAAGTPGRMFISTDTFAFYRDNGTSWDLVGGPGIGTVTGSGAAGQVSFWTGASIQSGSSNLFWDNTNKRLGIGTSGPSQTLTVYNEASSNIDIINNNNGVNMTNLQTVSQIQINGRRNGSASTLARITTTYIGDGITRNARLSFGVPENSGFGGSNFSLKSISTTKYAIIGFNSDNYSNSDTTITTTYASQAQVIVSANSFQGPAFAMDIDGAVKAILFNTGNFAIGTTTDGGFRLDVNGIARVQGLLSSYGADFFVAQSAGAGADYFHVDDDPNISAGANNQTIAMLRLRDRGSNGVFTGVNRLGLIMETSGGGAFPFQLFSESGNVRIGFTSAASTTTKLSLKGSTNDSTALTINATASDDSATLRAFNSNQVIVGAGGTLSASAALQVESTTRGFLPPRMTGAQVEAIASPATGLLAYATNAGAGAVTSAGWWGYNGATWVKLN